MNRRRLYYLVGVVLLVAFAGFSYSEFRDAFNPYVPFDTARDAGRTVQVAGGLAPNSSSYDVDAGFLRFSLVDPEGTETFPVRYEGLKPANFEDAISIVAIGRWDPEAGEFAADNLLVKCPSKYQGIEGAEEKTY